MIFQFQNIFQRDHVLIKEYKENSSKNSYESFIEILHGLSESKQSRYFPFLYTSWMMKDNYWDPKFSSQINHSLLSTLRNFYCDEKI